MTTLAPPIGGITRSADHRYTFDGKTYPGVTGILSVIDKSAALMSWAARQTAEAALAMQADLKKLNARMIERGDGSWPG